MRYYSLASFDGELAPSSVRKLRCASGTSRCSPLEYVVLLSGLQLMLAVIVICLKARAVLLNEPWRFRTSASVRLIRFFSSEQDFPSVCAISVFEYLLLSLLSKIYALPLDKYFTFSFRKGNTRNVGIFDRDDGRDDERFNVITNVMFLICVHSKTNRKLISILSGSLSRKLESNLLVFCVF